MKTLQKFGGFAALYLAVAFLIGLVIFLAVLDYPSITDPAQKVALLGEMQMIIIVRRDRHRLVHLVGDRAAAQQSGQDSVGTE